MKVKTQFVIVDYGVGNLKSLIRAFEHFGANVKISEDAQVIKTADALILPGDGSFKSGIRGLKIRGLVESIKKFAKSEKPILGICLGAQIIFTWGFEFGKSKGLDLINGKVVKFPKLEGDAKIPQIGWNGIYAKDSKLWKHTILDSVKNDSDVYYINSYILAPADKNTVLAASRYGGVEFCSVVKKNNIYGCQFHPEKSGVVGLAIIKNFISLVEK